jgi:6-pyruvoyltetrahydropterin/6-carboxytetrahydropterin synthase
MYSIRKQFTFSAAHHLTGLAEDHPCMRQHGHNYIVELVLSSKLNEVCFVRDYRDLDKFKKWLDETVDHKDLNEVLPSMQTTAENLAYFFYNVCRKQFSFHEITMVRVSETPKTWAEYWVEYY